jgi:hypothetical protein
MSNFRQPTFVLLSIVAFLVLAVVASVEYSGNKEKADAVKEGGLYRATASAITAVDKFFTTPEATTSDNVSTDSDSAAEKNNVWSRVKEYIQIQKTDSGWEFTLQNAEGIIFYKEINFR